MAVGAAVAMAQRDSLPVMFLAATAGSTVGAVITYEFGRWLRTHGDRARSPRLARVRVALEEPMGWLGRRGVVALVIGRFVPVGRALVVVAAGFASVPRARALPAAAAGAALWNAVLFAVGGAAGSQHARIERWLTQYSRVAGVLVALAATAWLVRAWLRRRSDRAGN